VVHVLFSWGMKSTHGVHKNTSAISAI